MAGQISMDEYLSSGWPAVLSAVDTVTEFFGKAWEAMMANPLLTVYVAAGLFSVGISFFIYLRRASRH